MTLAGKHLPQPGKDQVMRCFAALMTALLIIAGPGAGGILAQTTYDVPQAGDLDEVIDGADSGDFVRVSNNINDNEPYGAITMKAGVTVYAKAGESPKIRIRRRIRGRVSLQR